MTWLNPPLSRNVQTNVGKIFLQLKHFPKTKHLHKIFNRLYGESKLQLYGQHTKRHIPAQIQGTETMQKCQKTEDEPEKKSNCRRKNECPLAGKCLTSSIVYEPQSRRAIRS